MTKVSNKYIVFPLIRAGPQISAASLGIQIETMKSPSMSTATINTAVTRIVTIFYQKLNQNAYGPSMQTIKQ